MTPAGTSLAAAGCSQLDRPQERLKFKDWSPVGPGGHWVKPRVAGLQCLSVSLQGLTKGFPLVLQWDTGPARAAEDPTR